MENKTEIMKYLLILILFFVSCKVQEPYVKTDPVPSKHIVELQTVHPPQLRDNMYGLSVREFIVYEIDSRYKVNDHVRIGNREFIVIRILK